MICYFREGFKPSIKIEIEQQDREFINFEKMVQRAVNAEAKAYLRSSTMVWKSDARYSRGHCPFHNTSSKIQTQGTTAKETRTKENKPKKAKQANGMAFAPPQLNDLIKPNHQKKKKKYWKKKQNRKNSSRATEENAIKIKKGDGKYYNCQKKGHIGRNCPDSPKN